MTDWSEISFEDPKKTDVAKATPVLKIFAGTETKPYRLANTCPKCGKPLGKGGHFHCKGPK